MDWLVLPPWFVCFSQFVPKGAKVSRTTANSHKERQSFTNLTTSFRANSSASIGSETRDGPASNGRVGSDTTFAVRSWANASLIAGDTDGIVRHPLGARSRSGFRRTELRTGEAAFTRPCKNGASRTRWRYRAFCGRHDLVRERR